MSILSITIPRFHRKDFVFMSRSVRLSDMDGGAILFPCIALYHRDTGVPVHVPQFETWIFDLRRAELQKSETLRKKAVHVCDFLNFLLHETDCDRLQDVNLDVIRNFMAVYRETADGEPRNPEEWRRGITDVFTFLASYSRHNDDGYHQFQFRQEDLFTEKVVEEKVSGRKVVVKEINRMSVRAPKKLHKKYRLLLREHLDLLVFEAQKYDPMLTLGIMLQSYAGLREGEIVNLTMGRIEREYAGFGRIGKIVLDLTDDAPFAREYVGSVPFGSIKVPRKQEVFPNFLSTVIRALDEHQAMLEAGGNPTSGDAPLFVNRWGKPMTVDTYTGRVETLFKKHFLPELRRHCELQGSLPANAPYIEAYERSYPGAHMFRHWFTMYLLQVAKLTTDEISKWRGDSSIESMADYIHVNHDFIQAFKEGAFVFQRSLLEEVL